MPMGIVDKSTPSNGINEHTNTNTEKKAAPDTPSSQSPPVVRNVFHNAINNCGGGARGISVCASACVKCVFACAGERAIVRAVQGLGRKVGGLGLSGSGVHS